MICGACNREIGYKPETIAFHLDEKCKFMQMVVDYSLECLADIDWTSMAQDVLADFIRRQGKEKNRT